MALTHQQKKYLRKNLNKKPLSEILNELKISEEELRSYLKKIWKKEKYEKFWKKNQETKSNIGIQEKRLLFRSWFKKNILSILFLVILIALVYANSLNNDFLSDDLGGIVNNYKIDYFQLVFSNPFAFFQSLVYFIIKKLFGLSPAAFRIVSILFHTGNTILLYFLLSLIFSRQVGFISALIFSVHPLLTETVVWISAGYNAYATFWLLLAFINYLLALQRKEKDRYWFAVLLFFLSLESSEKMIAFPLALTFYEITTKRIKNNWQKLIPFFIISLVWGGYLLNAFGSRVTSLREDFYQQTIEVNTPRKFISRTFSNTVVAISSYLGLIFWPQGLTLYHSEMHFSKIEFAFMVLVFLIYLGTIVYAYFKNKKISFWLAFFFIMISPTLSPFGVSWVVAERYVYLAAAGIFVTIAAGLNEIIKNKKLKPLGIGLVSLIIIALSVRTIIRNHDWKNQDNLWLAAAKTSPSSPQNHNNLGDLYFRHHQVEKAIEEFQKAIQLNPGYAAAYHNLANAYYSQEKIDKATENYQKAVSINPRLWQSWQNLGKIYFDQGNYSQAIEALKKALQANPQNLSFYYNLAVIYQKMGEKSKAKETLKEGLKIAPNNPQIQHLLSALEKEE